jgi:hypothetical protein
MKVLLGSGFSEQLIGKGIITVSPKMIRKKQTKTSKFFTDSTSIIIHHSPSQIFQHAIISNDPPDRGVMLSGII